MRFQFSENILNVFEKELQPGIYDSLFFRFTGTNQAGQTVGHSDFTFIVNVNGEQKINVPGSWVYEYNKHMYGDVEDTSGAGAAFALAGKIDFSYFGIPNSLHVKAGDHTTFQLQHSGLSTKVASGNAFLYTLAGKSPQNYIPKLLQANRQVTGATTDRYRVPMDNITQMWINAASANVGKMILEKDNEVFVNASDYDDLIALTSLLGKFEGATASWIRVDMANGFSELLSDNVFLETTFTGADTLNVVVLHFEYSSVKRAQSVSRITQISRSKLSKYVSPKQADEVTVVKTISKTVPVFEVTDAPQQSEATT